MICKKKKNQIPIMLNALYVVKHEVTMWAGSGRQEEIKSNRQNK
jgi:hypothetical protein